MQLDSTISSLELTDVGMLGTPSFEVFQVRAEARRLAGMGIPTFPTLNKKPFLQGGFHVATTDLDQLDAWYQASGSTELAMPTGIKAMVFVLDADVKSGGLESVKALESEYTPLPETRHTKTASGGDHYFFKYPEDRIPKDGQPPRKPVIRNSAGAIAPGIDIRGEGGYVLMPGSVLPDGRAYVAESPDTPIAEAPEWLLGLIDAITSGYGGQGANVPIEPIPEGGRNAFLTSAAGAARRKGGDYNTILVYLNALNLQRCTPPLPEPEVESITRSISNRYAADPNAPKYTKALPELVLTEDQKQRLQPTAQIPTDFDMAVDFETVYGDQFLYDHKRKTWFEWRSEESRWNGNGAYSRAMQAKFRLSRSMRILVDTAPLTDAQKRDWYQVLRRAENGRIPEIQLERAAILPRLTEDAENFDADPHTANAGNAWLDTSKDAIVSGDFLREPDRANRVTKKLGALYDPEATAPRWEQFISEVFQGDEELIAYVQRAAGSSLDGLKLFQAFFVAFGHGRNGKSTFLNTIAKVMGDYAQSTAFDTFDVETKSATGNDLAALQGARLVLAIEAEQTRQLAEARIKAITGGDMVVCRFLYGEFFEYLPQYSVWLAVNYKPVVKGTDHGIWRRIQLIPFQAKFEGRADDKELPQKLAQERSGILNWLLAGLKDYYLQGLNPPRAVVEATKAYRAGEDTIGQWLSEEATLGEELTIGATQAYEAYVDWEKNDRKNLEPFKMKSFSGILEGKEVETDDGRAITIRKDTWRSGQKKNRVFFEGFTLRHLLKM